MLNWTIQTNRGDFEALSLEQVIQKMIVHYRDDERDPSQITEIYAWDDSGEITQQVSKSEISDIQELIEDEVREWKKEAEKEAEGFRAIQSDYFAGLI